MKQSNGREEKSTPVRPIQQPVSILRRSNKGSTSKRSKQTAAAASTIDFDYDTSDDRTSGNANNFSDSPAGSSDNFTPITDVNELADRLLKFKQSFEPSASSAVGKKGNQNHSYFTPTSQRRPPPPPPPRSSSSGKQRSHSETINPSSKDLEHVKQHRRYSDRSWSEDDQLSISERSQLDEAEDEYVRRMARKLLQKTDSSDQVGAAQDEYWSELNHDEGGHSPPSSKSSSKISPAMKDELKKNLNDSFTSANNNESSLAPRPVRVSQFEEKWTAQLHSQNSEKSSPSISKPVMAMASSLSTAQSQATKSLSTSPPQSSVTSSVPKNCDKRGRCVYHPQYKLYNKKLLGGYEFIANCPMCESKARKKLEKLSNRGTNRGTSSPPMNSRGRGGSKSLDRVPTSLSFEGDEQEISKSERERIRTRGASKSKEHLQRRSRRSGSGSGDGLRRSRGRSTDRNRDMHASFNSTGSNHGNGFTNALGNIRDKFNPTSLRRHRSLSSEAMQLFDEGECVGDRMDAGKDQRSLDRSKRGSSKDMTPRMSGSYDEKPKHKKKSVDNNPFVKESADVKFDKKTGRCIKHPSIVVAKKSAFRSNNWEIVKKCPFCAEKKVESDLGHGQGVDEETKRRMDLLLNGNYDDSGDTSLPSLSKNGEQIRGRKVSRMPYTTPMGETGWYTGEVDQEGHPHGFGRMRYKTGHSYEGEWTHGFGEVHMDNLSRMKSGFGSNKAAWKQSDIAPSVRKAAEKSSNGVRSHHAPQVTSSHGAMYQYQQQLPHQRQGYLLPQTQMHPAQLQQAQLQQAQLQQQQQAQLQQAWANMSPQERQMAMSQWYADNGMTPGHQSSYQRQGYPHM